MRIRALLMYTVLLSLTVLLLSGCGIFQGEQTTGEMDTPPEDASYTDDLETETGTDEQNAEGQDTESEDGTSEDQTEAEGTEAETVQRQLYLLDANGMVVPQTIELPKSTEVAQQSLEYMIKGGPVTELLPEGFEAVLPAGTEIIGLNLEEDGTLIVDVSKEFAEYRPEDELKILQAMTYTLTQFDNVDKIKLWINGYEQKEMPVNGTPMNDGYSRVNGINIYESDSVDFMDSKAVTLYYPAQQDGEMYFVPVTQHVAMDTDNTYASLVQALVNGPAYNLDLYNVFNSGVELAEQPEITEGVLSLTFNENIFNDLERASISDEVMETLVLTLTEQPGVEAVDVSVSDYEQVFNSSGVPYSEPVSRDTFVPTGSY
ncbi:GerMN domain-containing protein [Radiobacillus sp. PE A8.2]|uniref:GerMN domain-containing protein n=1 Tax=Radiobacillus sp. PE A8.2 TaxID=3380349 RepID=UPI00388DDF41